MSRLRPASLWSQNRRIMGHRNELIRLVRRLFAGLLAVCATMGAASEPQPVVRDDIAVIYNSWIDDSGFNRLVSAGVASFEKQKHIKVRVLSQPTGEMFQTKDLERTLLKAFDEGVRSVVILGPVYRELIADLSVRVPNIRFVVVDSAGEEPGNVQSVRFRSYEGSYLAGMVAARASRSGVIGFVGGLDNAGIRAFGCAYAQGAKALRPELKVLGAMIGKEPSAFSDPVSGRQRARTLLDMKADVIFAAAGASGLGALEEIARVGAYGIGVDDNQNGLHPGRILTSVIKRMDVSVYTTLVALNDGTWKRGLQDVGLSEGAIGLAMDEHNRHLISADTRAELEAAEFAIRSGELAVIDAQVDDSACADLIQYPAEADGAR